MHGEELFLCDVRSGVLKIRATISLEGVFEPCGHGGFLNPFYEGVVFFFHDWVKIED